MLDPDPQQAPERVVVFIDYQNAYNGARRAFESELADPQCGQFNPKAIGMRVAGNRELTEVRVYRGQPSAEKQRTAAAACSRQVAFWKHLSLVTPITRPLRYPRDWPDGNAEEKGIDVQIAIDFVRMAAEEKFDVGVIFTADTDLKPPIEMVHDLRWGTCEVAAWNPPQPRYAQKLSFSGRNIYCHYLDEAFYRQASDPTDYSIGRR